MKNERTTESSEDKSVPKIEWVRPDLVLIGTSHGYYLDSANEFHQTVESSDFLLIEGNEVLKELGLNQDFIGDKRYIGYEAKAIQIFGRRNKSNDIYSLEENTDHFSLMVDQGIDLKMLILDMHFWMRRNETEPVPLKDIDKIAGGLKKFNPSLIPISQQSLSELIRDVDLKLCSALKDQGLPAKLKLLQASQNLMYFNTQWRDLYVICPKILTLMDDLKGIKSIVIGRAHLDMIRNSIATGEVQKPVSWMEFRSSLDSESQDSLLYLEQLSKS